MKKNIRKILIYPLLSFLFAFSQISFGQHSIVPIDMQIKVIPKVLSLDRNLNLKSDTEYNFAILYSSQQRKSLDAKNEIEEELKRNKIKVSNYSVNLNFIDISSINNIENNLIEQNIDAIYITPLRGINIDAISRICKEEKILSITGVLEFMENDVSVSFDIKNKKLEIVINNNSAKEEGTFFSSRLLRIAKLL